MPVNRNALIRYRTIDKCLQNRRRKWTIENLIEACNQALYEYDGVEKGVSLRTIRMDLQALRSSELGYNAPIVVSNKKYYSYEDANYSITNIPLSPKDLSILTEVSQLLKQFKGFTHFNEVTEMVSKLDDKIYSEQFQTNPVIDFEKNELLTGLDWLDILYRSIVSKTTVLLKYQSFKARNASDIIFYPYLLKEYRNRWFLVGTSKSSKTLLTLALDRIQQVVVSSEEKFVEHKHFDPATYFAQLIGVTRSENDLPVTVTFKADSNQAPYIKTKPIHSSQTILEEAKGFSTFSIQVIPNFELERELIGFGEGLQILSPKTLVRRMKRKVRLMHEIYEIIRQ